MRREFLSRALKEIKEIMKKTSRGKSDPHRGNRKCKGPKAEVCLINWKKTGGQCGWSTFKYTRESNKSER